MCTQHVFYQGCIKPFSLILSVVFPPSRCQKRTKTQIKIASRLGDHFKPHREYIRNTYVYDLARFRNVTPATITPVPDRNDRGT